MDCEGLSFTDTSLPQLDERIPDKQEILNVDHKFGPLEKTHPRMLTRELLVQYLRIEKEPMQQAAAAPVENSREAEVAGTDSVSKDFGEDEMDSKRDTTDPTTYLPLWNPWPNLRQDGYPFTFPKDDENASSQRASCIQDTPLPAPALMTGACPTEQQYTGSSTSLMDDMKAQQDELTSRLKALKQLQVQDEIANDSKRNTSCDSQDANIGPQPINMYDSDAPANMSEIRSVVGIDPQQSQVRDEVMAILEARMGHFHITSTWRTKVALERRADAVMDIYSALGTTAMHAKWEALASERCFFSTSFTEALYKRLIRRKVGDLESQDLQSDDFVSAEDYSNAIASIPWLLNHDWKYRKEHKILMQTVVGNRTKAAWSDISLCTLLGLWKAFIFNQDQDVTEEGVVSLHPVNLSALQCVLEHTSRLKRKYVIRLLHESQIDSALSRISNGSGWPEALQRLSHRLLELAARPKSEVPSLPPSSDIRLLSCQNPRLDDNANEPCSKPAKDSCSSTTVASKANATLAQSGLRMSKKSVDEVISPELKRTERPARTVSPPESIKEPRSTRREAAEGMIKLSRGPNNPSAPRESESSTASAALKITNDARSPYGPSSTEDQAAHFAEKTVLLPPADAPTAIESMDDITLSSKAEHLFDRLSEALEAYRKKYGREPPWSAICTDGQSPPSFAPKVDGAMEMHGKSVSPALTKHTADLNTKRYPSPMCSYSPCSWEAARSANSPAGSRPSDVSGSHSPRDPAAFNSRIPSIGGGGVGGQGNLSGTPLTAHVWPKRPTPGRRPILGWAVAEHRGSAGVEAPSEADYLRQQMNSPRAQQMFLEMQQHQRQGAMQIQARQQQQQQQHVEHQKGARAIGRGWGL